MISLQEAETNEKILQLEDLLSQGHITKDVLELKKGQLRHGPKYTAEIHEELTQLKELLDDKTLTQEDYDKKKEEVLAKLKDEPKDEPKDEAKETTVSSPPPPVATSQSLAILVEAEIKEKLQQLQELKEAGYLTQEQFETKTAQLTGQPSSSPSPQEPTSISISVESEVELCSGKQPSAPSSPRLDSPILDAKLDAEDLKKPHKQAKGKEVEVELPEENLEQYSEILKEKILQLKELLEDGVLTKEIYDAKKKEFIEKTAQEEESKYPLELKEKLAQLEELLQDGIISQEDHDTKKKHYVQAYTSGLDPAKLAKLAQLDELLKDGIITEEEYQKRRKELEGPSEKEKAEKIFKYFNKDGSGKLSVKEFQALCFEMGEVFTSAEVQTAIEEIDLDGDGLIDFEEFYKWWTSKALDKSSENQKLLFLRMKLQSESYLRTIKGFAEKLTVSEGGPTAIMGIDATVTVGSFKESLASIKIRSTTDKSKAADIFRLCGVASGVPCAFAVIDLKSGVNPDTIKGVIDLVNPFIKKKSKDSVQIKLHTNGDKTQLVLSLSADEERAAAVSSLDLWEHLQLELDLHLDSLPGQLDSNDLGLQFRAKGTIPRNIIEGYFTKMKEPGLQRLFKLFTFGKLNLKFLPLEKLLGKLWDKDPLKAAPLPVLKGWASVKELVSYIFFQVIKEQKEARNYLSTVFHLQTLLDKVNSVGFVVNDTTVDLTMNNINIFDLLPNKNELALKLSGPKQIIKDDLKLNSFTVFPPEQSEAKIIPVTASSSSSSGEDEDAKNEMSGKYNKNIAAILQPNYRYWKAKKTDTLSLLFKSETAAKISHVIVQTPRFTAYPLKSALLFAYDEDPRIKKKKNKDDEAGYSSGEEASQYIKKDKVMWPPIVKFPQSKLPFAYIEIPKNAHYIEIKLPTVITAKYIVMKCLDGWEKGELRDAPSFLQKILGYKSYKTISKNISIQFVGFVGPAEEAEVKRDVGTMFGIFH